MPSHWQLHDSICSSWTGQIRTTQLIPNVFSVTKHVNFGCAQNTEKERDGRLGYSFQGLSKGFSGRGATLCQQAVQRASRGHFRLGQGQADGVWRGAQAAAELPDLAANGVELWGAVKDVEDTRWDVCERRLASIRARERIRAAAGDATCIRRNAA